MVGLFASSIDLTHYHSFRARVLQRISNEFPETFTCGFENLRVRMSSELLPEQLR
jgi:hypothetical protein